MPSTFVALSEFKARDKVSPTLSKMSNNFGKFMGTANRNTTATNSSLALLSRNVANVSSTLGIAGGLITVGALVRNVTSTIVNYQAANSNLASILNKPIEKIKDLTQASKGLGVMTKYSATQSVGAQTELAKLGNKQSQILNMAPSTLYLGSATNTALDQSAKQLGAALKGFDLASTESQRVADVMSASTSKSALDMYKLDVALPKVAPLAEMMDIDLEGVMSLYGKLADAGFEASGIATSSRQIILKLADSSSKLNRALGTEKIENFTDLVQRLQMMKSKNLPLKELLDLTNDRSVAAMAKFVSESDGLLDLYSELKDSEGFAELMSIRQTDNIQGSIYRVQSAWEGLILSVEDGTGTYASNIKFILDVTADMLNIMSGMEAQIKTQNDTANQYVKSFSSQIFQNPMGNMLAETQAVNEEVKSTAQQLKEAKEKAAEYAKKIREVSETILTWGERIGKVILAHWLLKTSINIAKTAMEVFGWVITGANRLWKRYIAWTAASNVTVRTATISTRAHSIALFLQTAATKVATIATSIFGVALNTAIWPITLIVGGIALLAFGIYKLVKHWKTALPYVKRFGILLAVLLAPLTLVVGSIAALGYALYHLINWKGVGDFFTSLYNTVAAFGETLYQKTVTVIGSVWDLFNMLLGVEEFDSNNLIYQKFTDWRDALKKLLPEISSFSRMIFGLEEFDPDNTVYKKLLSWYDKVIELKDAFVFFYSLLTGKKADWNVGLNLVNKINEENPGFLPQRSSTLPQADNFAGPPPAEEKQK